MEKTYVLFSEILETVTPKNEKLGKIVTRKNSYFTVVNLFQIFLKFGSY